MSSKALILIFALCTTGLGKDDENRPYEFGFKIDGEQHRHEKKDENGIINGEFGFITADGIYHVTVYATDENGNFKIISMKNLRVKPYPTLNSLTNERSPNPSTARTTVPPTVSLSKQPTRACSQCRLPPQPSSNSGSKNKKVLTPADVKILENPMHNFSPNNPAISGNNLRLNTNLNQGSNYGTRNNPKNQQAAVATQAINQHPPIRNNAPNQGENNRNLQTNRAAGSDSTNIRKNPRNQQAPETEQAIYPRPSITNNVPNQSGNSGNLQTNRATGSRYIKTINSPNNDLSNGKKKPLNFNDEILNASEEPQFAKIKSNKPVLVAAQMKPVPKSREIYTKKPDERDGLPRGLEKKDMEKILYKFNYTLGFHGHEEEGYISGAKKGHYFITGRNGERLRVDYVADENGFRPKITKEVLDVLSDEVPKPETEKDERYAGIKHYEFKWLYFPRN